MNGKFKLEWDKIGERFYETGVDRGGSGILCRIAANMEKVLHGMV